MAELTPRQAVGPVAYYSRIGDLEGEAAARRDLAEAKIAAAIERALAVAPKLTHAQVKRLSGLLHGGKS